MAKASLPQNRADTNVMDVATLLALDIPADCRTGLLANFDLLRAHAVKLEAGLKAARTRTPRFSKAAGK